MKTFDNDYLAIIICVFMKLGILLSKFLLIVLILCGTRNKDA